MWLFLNFPACDVVLYFFLKIDPKFIDVLADAAERSLNSFWSHQISLYDPNNDVMICCK